MTSDFPGSGEHPNSATSLSDCINACSADSACGAYIFDGNAVTCTLVHTSLAFQYDPHPDVGVAYGIQFSCQ
jgi:hypothetical protein